MTKKNRLRRYMIARSHALCLSGLFLESGRRKPSKTRSKVTDLGNKVAETWLYIDNTLKTEEKSLRSV